MMAPDAPAQTIRPSLRRVDRSGASRRCRGAPPRQGGRRLMFNRLSIAAQLHPRKIIAGAVLLFVAGGIAASSVFNVLKPFGFEDPASESIKARESLERAAGTEP